MGCDIHPLLFVKNHLLSDDWRFKAVPPRDRHYAFFGALAGVRYADVPAASPPRGFPEWFMKPDYAVFRDGREIDSWWLAPHVSMEHTPSWLSLADMKAHRAVLAEWQPPSALEFTPEDITELLNSWDEWITLMEFYQKAAWQKPGDDDVVIVFDFDS